MGWSPSGHAIRVTTLVVLSAVVATIVASCGSAPMRLSFRVLPSGSASADPAAVDQIRQVVKRRLEDAKVANASVSTVGGDRIVVEVPRFTEIASIERLVEQRGELTFVPLPGATYGTAQSSPGGPAGVVDGEPLPDDPDLVPLFGGGHLTSADPATDEQGLAVLDFTFDDEARTLFAAYTQAHVGGFFAIVLDGEVISSPSIAEPITGGAGRITMGVGPDAIGRSNALAAVLRYGPLPFPLELEDPLVPSTSP